MPKHVHRRTTPVVAAVVAAIVSVGCPATGSSGSDSDVEDSVEAFYEAAFRGDVDEVWRLVSDRCAELARADGVEDEVDEAVQFLRDNEASVGPYDLEITRVDDTTRRVTYTVYDGPGVERDDTWVLEAGTWKLDSCEIP